MSFCCEGYKGPGPFPNGLINNTAMTRIMDTLTSGI